MVDEKQCCLVVLASTGCYTRGYEMTSRPEPTMSYLQSLVNPNLTGRDTPKSGEYVHLSSSDGVLLGRWSKIEGTCTSVVLAVADLERSERGIAVP